jgi:Methyltransferase domain
MNPSDSPERLVDVLYQCAFRRPADQAAIEHYASELRRGRPVADIAQEFLDCDEFRQAASLFVPPGHFYSPVVDPRELRPRHPDLWNTPAGDLPGLRLDADAMLARWHEWRSFLREIPFPASRTEGFRYYFENDQFSWGDASIYYAMLRSLRPARLIEVGSGYSSALALDTVDRHFPGAVQMSFIEPYPDRLRGLLTEEERGTVHLLQAKVQDVPVSTFEALEDGDLLFIDSTHIVKSGSDVCFELFEVLPRLRRGVTVHFHDIFFPFEYPPDWALDQNRSWNEAHALRAFLIGNDDFEVVFFNDFFRRRFPQEASDPALVFGRNSGGSLWLRKRR